MISPPTSDAVARLAKVSQSAVSRTFTPGASVSAKTREKVLKAAAELGYRPNALARAMISGRSRLIAILVAYLDNQFYPVVLDELSRRLQAEGFQILLFMTETGNQDAVVERILQYQVEGIVMLSATLSSSLAVACSKTGVPVVLLNRTVDAPPASSITCDNIDGGRLAADFLVRGGHSRIAYIAGAEDSSTNRDREAGFLKGLADCGRELYCRAVGGYTFEGAKQAAFNILNQPLQPDAIFVANDHMAFAVIDVVRSDFNLKIPTDVSIIGYDDVPEAAWKAYDMTTISQSAHSMVDAAVEILTQQSEGNSVEQRNIVLKSKLIIRSSARIPPV